MRSLHGCFDDKQKSLWPNTTIRAYEHDPWCLTQMLCLSLFVNDINRSSMNQNSFFMCWNFVSSWIFLRSTKENHLFKIFDMEKLFFSFLTKKKPFLYYWQATALPLSIWMIIMNSFRRNTIFWPIVAFIPSLSDILYRM